MCAVHDSGVNHNHGPLIFATRHPTDMSVSLNDRFPFSLKPEEFEADPTEMQSVSGHLLWTFLAVISP